MGGDVTTCVNSRMGISREVCTVLVVCVFVVVLRASILSGVPVDVSWISNTVSPFTIVRRCTEALPLSVVVCTDDPCEETLVTFPLECREECTYTDVPLCVSVRSACANGIKRKSTKGTATSNL
jgi:hypothetical protein